MSVNPWPPFTRAARKAINLHLFEDVLGAQRTPDGHRWGQKLFIYDFSNLATDESSIAAKDAAPAHTEPAGRNYGEEDARWRTAYAGPDFLRDANFAMAAEEGLLLQGLMQPYMVELLRLNGRNWSALVDDSAVYEFWFSLAHMPPWQRAAAAATCTGMNTADPENHTRTRQLVAIGNEILHHLAGMTIGEMTARHAAADALRQRVQRLTVPQAVRLAALAESGRREAAAWPEVGKSIDDDVNLVADRLPDQAAVIAYLLKEGVWQGLAEAISRLA